MCFWPQKNDETAEIDKESPKCTEGLGGTSLGLSPQIYQFFCLLPLLKVFLLTTDVSRLGIVMKTKVATAARVARFWQVINSAI